MSGASGFIGSNVLEYLLDETDWAFTCVSSWRHKGSSQRLAPHDRLDVITHDLIGPLPELGGFDFILNLASESHVDRSIESPVAFIENNVSTTLQMLEYARRHPPTLFVQFSTDEVFGAVEHDEWDVMLPSNPYAASKAAQEMCAIAYWSTYRIPVVITNSNNIVGPRQDGEKFVPKIVDLIRRGEIVTIHTSDGRPGRRHYNSVRNIADAVHFLLRNADGLRGNLEQMGWARADRPLRVSIPGGLEIDNFEMAKLVADMMGARLKWVYVDAETVRPGYDEFYGRSGGALEKCGWAPRFTVFDELQRIVDQ